MNGNAHGKRYFAFIPVVNGFDLLAKAVTSVVNQFDEIIIIDNSRGGLDECRAEFAENKIIELEDKSFAGAQNWARRHAINEGYDFYIFMHNDGEASEDMPTRFIEFINECYKKQPDWGVVFTHYDVICAFNTEVVKTIGVWGDEKWPERTGFGSYVFDIDYYRRIRLAGYEIIQSDLGEYVTHHASSTINNDPELKKIIDKNHELAIQHYVKKWGGEIGSECYSIPFGTDEEQLANHSSTINYKYTIEKVGDQFRITNSKRTSEVMCNGSTIIVLELLEHGLTGLEIFEKIKEIFQKSSVETSDAELKKDIIVCLNALVEAKVIRRDSAEVI